MLIHLVVWNVPSGQSYPREHLRRHLKSAVVNVLALGVRPIDVGVSMPLDSEIQPVTVVTVDLLTEKPGWTNSALHELGEAIADAVKRFESLSSVEVVVRRFHQSDDAAAHAY